VIAPGDRTRRADGMLQRYRRNDGAVRVEPGFVRSEDEPAPEPVENEDEQVTGADPATDAEPEPSEAVPAVEPEEPDGLAPLSERLVEELTTPRTAGLQLALMDRPDMALIATVHALALRTFYGAGYNPQTCLKIEAAPVMFTHVLEQRVRGFVVRPRARYAPLSPSLGFHEFTARMKVAGFADRIVWQRVPVVSD
jgi:ParB family transcriptional regulator, chromosome partitioning protein